MASSGVFMIIIIIIISSITTSNANIRSSEIRSDSRRIIQLNEFGFTQNGRVELSISKLNLSTNHDHDLSKLGFFLCPSSKLLDEIIFNDSISCALESNIIKPVYNFSKKEGGFNLVYHESDDTVPYLLVFANCLNHDDVTVSMDVVSAMYNLNGKSPNYLSAGLTNLPWVYFFVGVVYFTMTTTWAYLLFKTRTADVCHYNMLMLILAVVSLKSTHMLCQANGMFHTSLYGTDMGWDLSFYCFRFLNGVTFFTLLLWIASSWKPALERHDRNLITVIVPLQILHFILLLVIHLSSLYVSVWILVFNILVWLVDWVCCVLVLYKYIDSSVYLEKEARDTTGPKADHILMILKRFRCYFFFVCCYFFFTRIGLLGFRFFTSYKYQWTFDVASEAIHLAFYVLTGCFFKPELHNPYILFNNILDLELGF